jgi:hypothetical protein
MTVRRRNTAWLAITGALVAIVLLSGVASAPVAFTLAALYAAALLASIIQFQPTQLIDRSRSTLKARKMSSDAREASERARRRGGILPAGLTLEDVGLITSQSSREGMVMRRTRAVSKDDDGVRPFLVLNVEPRESERNATIRFEIIDQNGQEQYVYEQKTYLRDGAMNILADHHLPLSGNDHIQGMGDWDLRAYVDGSLVGVLSFNVAPSLEERNERLNRRASSRTSLRGEEAEENLVLRDDDDAPLSLEDLLRSSANNHQRRQ